MGLLRRFGCLFIHFIHPWGLFVELLEELWGIEVTVVNPAVVSGWVPFPMDEVLEFTCHGLAAATGYSDSHFPYRTADSSFSIDDLISSPLPIVVARYFFTLPVPSPSFLTLPFPSGTFRSRSSYVPLPSGSFCTLPTCSG
jgi:hypothetical protein